MPIFVVKIHSWRGEVDAETREKAKTLGIKKFKEITHLDMPNSYIYPSVRVSSAGRFFEQRKEPLDLLSLSEEEAQWLTGFFEGDGYPSYSETPGVYFAQKEIQPLEYIRDLVGLEKAPKWGGSSGVYYLDVYGRKGALPLLELFAQYLVCPERVVQMENVSMLGNLGLSVGEHEPSIPWAVGFWDAEGWSSLTQNGVELGIGQKDKRVLEKLANLMGGYIFIDSAGFHRLDLRGEPAKRFASACYKYSHNQGKLDKLKERVFVLSQAGERPSDKSWGLVGGN